MTDEQRSRYFGHFWPAACQAKGWRKGDEVRRRHTVGECMAAIRAPITESSSALDEPQITALFCYLDHLANPHSLEKSQRWVDCQTDYMAYNLARQADWHQRKAYGGKGKSNRLNRDRFGGQASAQGEPQEVFDPEAIRKRHMTLVNRHKAKGYRPKPQAAGVLRHVVAGQNVASPTPASVPVPAAVEDENPF